MKKMFNAFGYAFAGLRHAFTNEQNVRIEFILAGLALSGGFILDISATEWCFIILCISIVLSLEFINTAIENLCNRMQVGYDADIGRIKDMAAAAVLIASLAALGCGAVIFIPKIISLI